MPISLPFNIRNLTSSEFDEIDATVMQCAYNTQNTLGRLYDERVYENRLLGLLRQRGMDALSQQPIVVTHEGFSKTYFLDLVVDHAIYELKTVKAFVPEHDVQVFHYALLTNVNHIKLLNFRLPRVQGKLRYNAVLSKERHAPQWELEDWRPITVGCDELQSRFRSLVNDWGTHLDFRLYEEALCFFSGGEPQCKRRVPVVADGVTLGSHECNCHGPDVSFMITGFDELDSQRHHIQQIRRFTQQRAIQWFNMNKHAISLTTVFG